MNITLRQINIFVEVANHLSITKAANSLFLTQPAVSMQIKQLENMVDLPLLNHIGKKLSLTQAGEEFLKYCIRIKNELYEAKELMQEFKGVKRGTLNISVASTLSHFAVDTIKKFLAQHPKIKIKFEVNNRYTVLENLKNSTADIVLMGKPPLDQDLEFSVIKENPLIVIAPPNHQLADKKNISLRELCKHTFVIREKGSGTRLAFKTLLDINSLKLSEYMTINNNESIKLCVEAGLGLGVVSIHTTRSNIKNGSIVQLDVDKFPILKQWYIVNRRSFHLPAVAQVFRDFVINQIQFRAE
jgi:DNA-binding transcriptional LysR family regulator